MTRESLKPIVKDYIKEAIDSEDYRHLEQMYAESPFDVKLTNEDRRIHLFRVVFEKIRNEDDEIKIRNLIKNADVFELVAKVLEQAKYIINLEVEIANLMYSREDLEMQVADLNGHFSYKNMELAELIIECIDEMNLTREEN